MYFAHKYVQIQYENRHLIIKKQFNIQKMFIK